MQTIKHKKTSGEISGSLDFLLQYFNYSMIVATRPDPTVRPPSRTFAPEIIMFSGDFKGIFNTFFLDMRLVSEVFGLFVIMVLSQDELCPFAF